MRVLGVAVAVMLLLVGACRQHRPPSRGRDGRVEKEVRRDGYDVEQAEGTSAHAPLFRQASARLDAGDVPGARALYDEARRLEPASAEPLVGLGTCALREGRLDEARTLYGRAQMLDARSALARIGLGSALYGEQRFADAARAYEEAVALDERNADAHWGAAAAYSALGQRGQARTHARRFLALAPDSALAPRALEIAGALP
jgi:tetratricopeptide (TPR) repeat protein